MNRFVSREAAKLSYRSQSRGYTDELFALRDKVDEKLEGNIHKGPARGANRQKLLAERERMNTQLDAVGVALSGGVELHAQNAGARSERSKARLESARKMIEGDRSVTPAQVLGRYGAVVEDLKNNFTRKAAMEFDPCPSTEIIDRPLAPELDLKILYRLGYLKPGKLTGNQIAWPRKWLGANRRIFLLVDMRKENYCCTVVIQNGRQQPKLHFFWMTEHVGPFGKPVFAFESPDNGKQSDRLLYRKGRVILDT